MSTNGQNSKNRSYRNDNIIEALREFGNSTSKSLNQDLIEKIPQDFLDQTGLTPKKSTEESSQEALFYQERLQSQLKRQEYRQTQEKLVYTSKERETKSQVSILLQEVQRLSTAVQTLDTKVQVAAMQAPVDPGVYHINFFEKLISFIKSLTQKVEDASAWVSTSRSRSKKKSHYWSQFETSGTKFMLSQERYMSTQAG